MSASPVKSKFQYIGRKPLPGEATVYGLVDPRDLVIRYVGSTRKHARDRAAGHWSGAIGPVGLWINELKSLPGQPRPIVVALEIVPWQQHKAAEKRWIRQYTAWGAPLVNAYSRGGVAA